MKVCIATGVYPPEIGGPAFYAEGLLQAFKETEHTAWVVTYGHLKKLPSGIRHIVFGLKLIPSFFKADAIIVLDTFSVGLPAYILNIFFRKRMVLRIGGDFLWEQYVARTKEKIPLSQFYVKKRDFSLKEHFIYSATRRILQHACVVFSTEWQKHIWSGAYGLTEHEDIHVIENAMYASRKGMTPEKKNFLWFVRDIPIKNGDIVREAFARAKKYYPEIKLETGNITHEALLEKMKRCYAVILPSVSEVSPNYILDALSFGKPFILTKDSGYAKKIAPYGLLVDPFDTESLMNAIMKISDDSTYTELDKAAKQFQEEHTYSEIAGEFISII